MKSNRREFIQSLGTGAAGLTIAAPLGLSSCANTQQTQEDDGQVLFVGDDIAVTETTNGKVRGYILRDIYYFLGIPYGADTSGKKSVYGTSKTKTMDRDFSSFVVGKRSTSIDLWYLFR